MVATVFCGIEVTLETVAAVTVFPAEEVVASGTGCGFVVVVVEFIVVV